MTPKSILKALLAGKQVKYTVRRLRGYLHGYASLVFKSADAVIGENNIADKLKNFRLDEKPYDKPDWTTENE